MTFPIDYYEARAAIVAAVSHYDAVRNPDAGLTPAQRRKRHGKNFMTDDQLTNRRVGPFMVEVATGTFLSNRLVGLTAFRFGGDREADGETCACVHSEAEMLEHLRKLEAMA